MLDDNFKEIEVNSNFFGLNLYFNTVNISVLQV